MKHLYLHIVICTFATLQLDADEFCALTVRLDTGADRFSSTWIELLDEEKRIVEKRYVSTPQFQICDFGFGRHSLRIGATECLPTVIENLVLRPGYPYNLTVRRNTCPAFPTSGNGCFVYFRLIQDGVPAPGVTMLEKDSRATTQSDRFGRISTWVVIHSVRRFEFYEGDKRLLSKDIECRNYESHEYTLDVSR